MTFTCVPTVLFFNSNHIPMCWSDFSHVRLCYFICKADLKARQYMHEFRQYYRCSQCLGWYTSTSFGKPCWFLETVYQPFLRTLLAIRLCDSCLASVGKNTHPAMNGRAFGCGIAWPRTRSMRGAYLQRESNHSPFVSIEGFRLETCMYDWLHNVNLGCGRDLFASGLRVLIQKQVWGPLVEWDTTLHQVHMEMHRTCAAEGPLDCLPFL